MKSMVGKEIDLWNCWRRWSCNSIRDIWHSFTFQAKLLPSSHPPVATNLEIELIFMRLFLGKLKPSKSRVLQYIKLLFLLPNPCIITAESQKQGKVFGLQSQCLIWRWQQKTSSNVKEAKKSLSLSFALFYSPTRPLLRSLLCLLHWA